MSISHKVDGNWIRTGGAPAIDNELSDTSQNPLENRQIYAALADKPGRSEFAEDDFVVETDGVSLSPSQRIFEGTTADWSAKSSDDKALYKVVILTDD